MFDNLHIPKAIHLIAPLILSLVCNFTLFYHLADCDLWDHEEGRSGVIAKEMVNSGNEATLIHNGKLYHDKPALYFRLVALSLKFLGLTEFAVRLPSTLAASLTVGRFICGGLCPVDEDGAYGVGIVLVSSLEFTGLGRFGKMDMLFSLLFSTGLLYFLWWQHRSKNRTCIWVWVGRRA